MFLSWGFNYFTIHSIPFLKQKNAQINLFILFGKEYPAGHKTRYLIPTHPFPGNAHTCPLLEEKIKLTNLPLCWQCSYGNKNIDTPPIVPVYPLQYPGYQGATPKLGFHMKLYIQSRLCVCARVFLVRKWRL